jgi:hypothetical protein
MTNQVVLLCPSAHSNNDGCARAQAYGAGAANKIISTATKRRMAYSIAGIGHKVHQKKCRSF